MSGDVIFDAAMTLLLAAWAQRLDELDAAKAALPDVERLVEFARTRLPAMLAATAVAAGPTTNISNEATCYRHGYVKELEIKTFFACCRIVFYVSCFDVLSPQSLTCTHLPGMFLSLRLGVTK